MSRLVNAVSAVARYEVERRTYCELAVVTSVFDGSDGDDSHTISVRLKDTGEVLARIPMAAPVSGLAWLPRVDDVVVVLFPSGEPSSAIAVAQVYSDNRRPPDFVEDEVRLQWPGDEDDPAKAAVVTIANDGDTRSVVVDLAEAGTRLEVTDGAISLTSGAIELAIAHSSSSDGSASISAGGTTIEVAQDGDVTIRSPGKIEMKASEIDLQADVSLKVAGQVVEIN